MNISISHSIKTILRIYKIIEKMEEKPLLDFLTAIAENLKYDVNN
jgi:hypothetical protein